MSESVAFLWQSDGHAVLIGLTEELAARLTEKLERAGVSANATYYPDMPQGGLYLHMEPEFELEERAYQAIQAALTELDLKLVRAVDKEALFSDVNERLNSIRQDIVAMRRPSAAFIAAAATAVLLVVARIARALRRKR